jgi:hypothetical protein
MKAPLVVCCFLVVACDASKLAQSASVPLGDPFHVRAGTTVELENGATLQFLRVTNDSRCPVDVTCVWQGEAFLEIELRAGGKSGRESISTERKDVTLLAHRVQALGLYPAPRSSEPVDPKDYVAMFRVAEAPSAGAKPFKTFSTRAEALPVAERYIRAFSGSAREICTDWETRSRVTYRRDSSTLCDMGMHIAESPQAVHEAPDAWHFYFKIDNAELLARMGQPVFMFVAVPKDATDALDQVRETDVRALP